MLNAMKVSKRKWYLMGGFSNSRLFRKARQGAWVHYVQHN